MGSSDYISIRPIKMSCSHARTAETQTNEPSKKIIFLNIVISVVSLLQGNEKTVVKINSNYVSRQNVVGWFSFDNSPYIYIWLPNAATDVSCPFSLRKEELSEILMIVSWEPLDLCLMPSLMH